MSVSYGLIDNIIDNNKIDYYCNTEEGSSYSPILSLKSFKLIGIHENFQNNQLNSGTFIKYAINKFNKYNEKEDKIINEINIMCKTNEEDIENIFGKEFVENIKNNIDLIINENKNDLFKKYKLKKGENYIKIIIKNKITNLEYMFWDCNSLKNIEKLKYFDTKDIKNFKSIFFRCSSLSDIKKLQNWNVSNGNDFSDMFNGCSSLTYLNGLQNWKVSNGNNFVSMFRYCSSLLRVKELQN